jgi:hypothetical protein
MPTRGIGSLSPHGFNGLEGAARHTMTGQPRKCRVVILAGGDGRRFGTLTTDADGGSTPKQYCSINGGPSLLHLSLKHVLGLVPRERIVPVVTEVHRRRWEPELGSNKPNPIRHVPERTRFRFRLFVSIPRFRIRDATSAAFRREARSRECCGIQLGWRSPPRDRLGKRRNDVSANRRTLPHCGDRSKNWST